ncbi:MAG: alpha/beta hydrolase [Thermodesulfovibrionales bacterium]|nr:alpha/beta hydrolase [Thermodesulfovibrionales bacterium]
MTTLAALKALALGLGGAAALMYGYLFISQEAMIFPGSRMGLQSPPDIADAYKDVEAFFLERPGGVILEGWLIDRSEGRGPGSPLLIYFGGNAEEVSGNIPDFHERFPGWSVALFNYRGFSASGGSPTEAALVKDALFIYDTLTDKHSPPKVVLMGRSLGCGVAVSLATSRKVDAMVLVSPFRSLVHLGRRYYPWVPVGLLLKHRFDSLTLVPELNMPTIVLAGASDSIIPAEESRALYEAMDGQASFVEIEGAGHNDIHWFDEYWEGVSGFLLKNN